MEMNHEYASKGVAGAGLGTGIAGLSLGVLNAMGGLAGFAGLFGNPSRNNFAAANDFAAAMMAAELARGSHGYCGDDAHVTQRELSLTQKLAEKDTQTALRDANTFTDQKMIELYKYIDGRFMGFEQRLGEQAVINQRTADSFQIAQERLDCCCNKMQVALESEAKERRCGDNAIVNYVNQTFYPKQVADVTVGTAMTPQSTYNPLPGCSCNCSR